MKQGTDPEGSIKILKEHIAEKEKQIAAIYEDIKHLNKDIQIIEFGYPKGERKD